MSILSQRQTGLPDHTQLPESDGAFVENFQELPQQMLLTDSLLPVLNCLRPDGQFAIGHDSGIYWRHTDPPLRGALAPYWFLVLGVPALLDGQIRRSYVLWQEQVPPLVVLEFVSGDGSEERDRTPGEGKFWGYEQRIRPAYYGIYEVNPGRIEMYQAIRHQFPIMEPNANGRYPIAELGVELGIWKGFFATFDLPWMRWWDNQGNLLLTGREQAEQERARAEAYRHRSERLAARLRALGIDPDAVNGAS